jgi:prolyl-tRNA synthetase
MSQTHASEIVSHAGRSSAGAIHRWSRTYIPTSKEAPADAEAISHRLLTRGGFIRRVGSGIYDYLPIGWRVLQKISQIVREEMDAIGSSEMLMPAMEPIELFAGTKRDVDYGDNLFRLTDRHGRVNALAPTHEEIITDAMKAGVSSYTQLPLTVYQIQTKFRDEFRPRSGLLRCREFIMKDAYSFHMNLEGPGGLNEIYEDMRRAYTNVFTRCGLDFTMVEAEAGPIGGSASHEFMVNAESGEDTILICPKTGYAANVEKCDIGERAWSFEGEPSGALEKVHTPNLPGIDEVGKFMKVKHQNMLKTLVFSVVDPSKAGGKVWALVTVRADHDVNEGKVKAAIGSPVTMADDKAARAAGFAIGYVSPRSVVDRTDTVLLVDPDAAQAMNAQSGKPMFWATGADEADHHVKHFNWGREMGSALDDSSKVRVADVRNAMPGDPSPRAEGAVLEARKGIEVGHIFKLGTKYSDAMGFQILGADQQRSSVIMGCYGIGVSRTMAACVEGRSDENGIVWPAAIAPYHIIITVMKPEPGSRGMEVANDLAKQLSRAGLDVLIDDRDERPGVKFKDADLIGVPIRLTLGDKALEQNAAEFKLRTDAGKGETVPLDAVVAKCLEAVGG